MSSPATVFHSRAATERGRLLSNFSRTPAPFEFMGERFWTIEAAFQAAKYECAGAGPDVTCELAAMSPVDAKRAGGRRSMAARGKMLDVAQWDSRRVDVMKRLVALRMDVDPAYKAAILEARATGERLVHFERGSPARLFWGGHQNMLGRILMAEA